MSIIYIHYAQYIINILDIIIKYNMWYIFILIYIYMWYITHCIYKYVFIYLHILRIIEHINI